MSDDIDEDRWVTERARYLSTHEVGFRERIAEAIAWSELGYSASGIAEVMDTSESTVRKYLEKARKAYPGILVVSINDLDSPTAPVSDLPDRASPQCPVCTKETLVGNKAAETIVSTGGNTSKAMVEDAETVCTVCHSVKIDGEWQRAQTVNSRAYELAEASSSKSAADYREILTQGIDPGEQARKENRSADDEDGW